MRKKHLFYGFIIISVFIAGCSKEEGDREKNVVMTIYPETGFGASIMSDIWTQPLIFSESDNSQKQMLVDILTEGFDFNYERGYEYKLEVKKIWMQDPPQDVSSIKYVLVNILSKEKVITEDSEENIELFVSSETVKFTPKFPSEYDEDNIPKIYDALKVRVNETNTWMALTEIEGFSFEAGNEYNLIVKKVIHAEPYSVNYVLVNVVSASEIE